MAGPDQKQVAMNNKAYEKAMSNPVRLHFPGTTIRNEHGKLLEDKEVEDGFILNLGWLGKEYRVAKGGCVDVPKDCAVHHQQVCRLHNTPALRLDIYTVEEWIAKVRADEKNPVADKPKKDGKK